MPSRDSDDLSPVQDSARNVVSPDVIGNNPRCQHDETFSSRGDSYFSFCQRAF